MQERQDPVPPTAHELTQEEREARRQEQIKRNQALIEMLNEWSEGDGASGNSARPGEFLKRLLES